MIRLGDRLRRSVGPTPSPSRIREALTEVGLVDRRRALNGAHAVSLTDAVGGGPVDTPWGPIWTITHRQPLTETHGDRQLGGFFTTGLDDVYALTGDDRLCTPRADDALFLDIEATGLDHGAGTLAFLVGVAYREDQELITRQYLLREPGEERALFHCLLADIEAHPLIVSFNGKSYDLTVLESRLVMCRVLDATTCRLKLRPHLDLLHLSRNLHRDRWDNTKLGTLERELLGFHRQDDLPGALVPSAWFHFLRTGDAAALGRAVEHNLHDVRSMVVLADALLATSADNDTDTRPPMVSLNLGRLLLRRGDAEAAVATLSRFLTPTDAEDRDIARALDALAIAARRTGRVALEVNALQRLRHLTPDDPEVLRRLSIAYERRVRDVPSALEAARAAWRLAPCPATSARVERLDARLQRARMA